jgi:hypothetical protein
MQVRSIAGDLIDPERRASPQELCGPIWRRTFGGASDTEPGSHQARPQLCQSRRVVDGARRRGPRSLQLRRLPIIDAFSLVGAGRNERGAHPMDGSRARCAAIALD